MPGPAATLTHMHTCPMYDGKSPHVGGPIVGPGVPTVLIGGKPAAVMGDQCTCSGPPDTIVQGEATVIIGGKPAATMGCATAHGGVITQGEPTVLIGTGATAATAVMPLDDIPFPEFSFISQVLGKNKEAKAQQEKIREAAESTEGEPRFYNPLWIKEEKEIRESKVLKQVTLRVSVLNIPDGTTVTFNVKKPADMATPSEEPATDEDVVTLTGTVQNQTVEVSWEVEDNTQEDEATNR